MAEPGVGDARLDGADAEIDDDTVVVECRGITQDVVDKDADDKDGLPSITL